MIYHQRYTQERIASPFLSPRSDCYTLFSFESTLKFCAQPHLFIFEKSIQTHALKHQIMLLEIFLKKH